MSKLTTKLTKSLTIKQETPKLKEEPWRRIYSTGVNNALKLYSEGKLAQADIVVLTWLMVNVPKGNTIPFTRMHIAEQLNISLSTVGRAFNRLRKYRLIVANLRNKKCLTSLLVWQGEIDKRFSANGKGIDKSNRMIL